jgi:uncharacterized membrane protein YgcG
MSYIEMFTIGGLLILGLIFFAVIVNIVFPDNTETKVNTNRYSSNERRNHSSSSGAFFGESGSGGDGGGGCDGGGC